MRPAFRTWTFWVLAIGLCYIGMEYEYLDATGWYCVWGPMYGQFGNNAISLVNALFYAQRSGLRLAILTRDPKLDALRSAFELPDVLWNATRVQCEQYESWESVFFKKDEIKAAHLDHYLAPPLAERHRRQAEAALARYDAGFTVHGRSHEGDCSLTARHEHTPVPCGTFKYNLCRDYRYQTVASLFQLGGTPVLMTDRQSPANDYSYHAQGGIIDAHELPVQLWMMVLSPRHVGSPGSSLDFLVWLWKRQFHNGTSMFPLECYPLGPTSPYAGRGPP